MADVMDFPPNPAIGQRYTAPAGHSYIWDGYTWTLGVHDHMDTDLTPVGSLIGQIRTLLQDTDNRSGLYRYSTESIITCINQGMMDLYRMRPDIFLELQFTIPRFSSDNLLAPVPLEDQYLPPLVYYTVGLVQARDDEQTQDARAAAFLKTFKETVLTVS